MKAGKRNRDKHPAMKRLIAVDERNKKCQDQVQQNNAPVLSDLDEHFSQIRLNIIATHNERNGQQQNADGNPD